MKKNESTDILNEILLKMIYDSSKTLNENVELLSEQGGGPYYNMYGDLVYTSTGNVVDAKKVYPNITDANKLPKKIPSSDMSKLNLAFSTKSLSSTIKTLPTTTYTPLTQRPGSRPQSDVLGPQGSFPKSLGVDRKNLEMQALAKKEEPLIRPKEFYYKLDNAKKLNFKKERERILKLSSTDKEKEFKEKNKPLYVKYKELSMVSPQSYVPTNTGDYEKELSQYTGKYLANQNEINKINKQLQYNLALYYPEKWENFYNSGTIDTILLLGKNIVDNIDDIQHFLDWVGLLPIIGDAVDLGNSAIYFSRALYEQNRNNTSKATDLAIEGALSLVAVIPLVGSPIKLALKELPFLKILKGGDEFFELLLKKIDDLPPGVRKVLLENLAVGIWKIGQLIDFLSKGLKKNKAVDFVLGTAITCLSNIKKALEFVLKKLGKQAIKWTGKIIDSPAGGTAFKFIRNLSKEACGNERQQGEWANQLIPESVPLLGGQNYGNAVCDLLSGFAWVSGPLGPLLSSTIEVQNAKEYYDDGEKARAALQVIFGLVPIGGLVGGGLIKAFSKETAEVLLRKNFAYKVAMWFEGSYGLKLTSQEVKAILTLNPVDLTNAKNYLKKLNSLVNWVYKNAKSLGLGENITSFLKGLVSKLLSIFDFVADFYLRLKVFLSAAKEIQPSLDKMESVEFEKDFMNKMDQSYSKYKDSITVSGDTIKVVKKSRVWKPGTKPKNSWEKTRDSISKIDIFPK